MNDQQLAKGGFSLDRRGSWLDFSFDSNKQIPITIGKDTPLSKELYDAALDSSYIIDGPFGLGLGLTDDSSGNFVMFSAGTGFLPFTDLFDFLLKKAIFMSAANENF